MASLKEFMERAKKETKGYLLVSLVDEYIVKKWDINDKMLEEKQKKILEIRFFNEEREIKLFRSDVSKEFHMRILEDDIKRDYIEETQYLDVDIKRCQGHEIVTTGGGKYHAPFFVTENAKVKIRYYIEQYEQSGQARVADWRIVSFEGVR